MDYGKFKQGSIIHGLRSEQYLNQKCSAIIITAECDIAQCKTSRFYYLVAMDVRTWMVTDGIAYTTRNKQISRLKSFINNFSSTIPDLTQYQNAATISLDRMEADIRSLPALIDTPRALRELEKIRTLRVEQNQVLNSLKQIINGDLIQYFFLPYSAYTTKRKDSLVPEDSCEGLIVNLQDIGFFDIDTVSKIESQDMDFEKLSESDLERYRKQFFLEKTGDMIFPEEQICSPYRERLMQAFSSSFIRIGIDFDSKAVKDYWDKVLKSSAQ